MGRTEAMSFFHDPLIDRAANLLAPCGACRAFDDEQAFELFRLQHDGESLFW
jgi:hypothetical protein